MHSQYDCWTSSARGHHWHCQKYGHVSQLHWNGLQSCPQCCSWGQDKIYLPQGWQDKQAPLFHHPNLPFLQVFSAGPGIVTKHLQTALILGVPWVYWGCPLSTGPAWSPPRSRRLLLKPPASSVRFWCNWWWCKWQPMLGSLWVSPVWGCQSSSGALGQQPEWVFHHGIRSYWKEGACWG